VDERARNVLRALARQAVRDDLDALRRELDGVRREVQALRVAAGLERPTRDERQQLVRRLREQGLSARTIAAIAGAHRMTVMADFRELGLPRPPVVLGSDGVTRRAPRATR
jgi:DNA invertase Pin-like site-specific DNA recombinase